MLQSHLAPLSLTVHARDALTRDGITAWLRRRSAVRVLTAGTGERVDVHLLLVGAVTESVLGEAIALASAPDPGGTNKVLLVGDDMDDRQLTRALDGGLAGYLVRSETRMGEVVAAARRCRAGQVVLPYTRLSALRPETGGDAADRSAAGAHGVGWSAREAAVIRLVAAGCETREIAAELRLSERTVRSTLSRILQVHGVRNRTHAVAAAVRDGVI
ncbi:LuxR C-terminal-related transcriptional regulator [Streptomyces sp. NPDC058955]|uniref:LuxR C-terminal-related transcriptional regulator n=1 Tax=unclassified Streptomyces TaxID=2593676 RepID=UPI0036464A79